MPGRRILHVLAQIGVRPQLSLAALIAIFPLLALLVFGALKNRALLLDAAAARAVDVAKLGAERQDDSFRDAENIVKVLRRLPPATLSDPASCHVALETIAEDYPQFTSIGFTDAKGMITCFSLAAQPQPLRDLDLFQATMAADTQAFVIGKFMIGPITGKRIVETAARLPPSAQREAPAGIAFVSVDLDRAARDAWTFAKPREAVLSLVDMRSATLLARSEQGSLAGEGLGDSPLLAAMRSHPQGGSVEAVDIDGTRRIFGFAPLRNYGPGIMVAAGLSRAAVMNDADRRLLLALAVATLTAAAAAVAAWLFADRMQFRPIRSLVETARKLGSGDLTAKANLPPWNAPEFRALDQTLGDMANGISAAHAELAARERHLRLLAENSTDMIMIVRPDGQREYVSPACRNLLGWEPEEMLRIRTQEAIHPDDLKMLEKSPEFAADAPHTLTYRMRRKDGSYVWVEAVARALPAAAGEPKAQLVVARDISQRVQAEQRLRESEMRYRILAEHGTDMVFQLDRDLVRHYVSPASREVLGYEPEEILGKRPLDIIHPEDRERVAQVYKSLLDGSLERTSVINRIRHRSGKWIWVEARLRALQDEGNQLPAGIIGALQDISVRKAAEDRLEEVNRRLEALAGQDGLTGLANRRTFDTALAREYRRAQRDGLPLGLIMIDVDLFKPFNDKYGHPAGDDCLKRVGASIANALRRATDVAARYGGEEFAVLLPGSTEADALAVADRIRKAVLALGIAHSVGFANVVTVSAGVASCVPDASDGKPDGLVLAADQALYRAKSSGRNVIVCASTLPEPAAAHSPVS